MKAPPDAPGRDAIRRLFNSNTDRVRGYIAFQTACKKLVPLAVRLVLRFARYTERRPRLHAGMPSMKTASKERSLRSRKRLARCPRPHVRLLQPQLRWSRPRSSPTTCTPCARDNGRRWTTRRHETEGSSVKLFNQRLTTLCPSPELSTPLRRTLTYALGRSGIARRDKHVQPTHSSLYKSSADPARRPPMAEPGRTQI